MNMSTWILVASPKLPTSATFDFGAPVTVIATATVSSVHSVVANTGDIYTAGVTALISGYVDANGVPVTWSTPSIGAQMLGITFYMGADNAFGTGLATWFIL